jgi:tripartite ATP-independent transporter DctM subunit
MTLAPEAVGGLGFVVLIVLVLLRLPIMVALGLTGLGGYVAIEGWRRGAVALSNLPFEMARNYSLSVLPLFILMGVVAARAGMARQLFTSANTLFSGLRGSLAMASVGACAGFGAISGSSVATAASIARIAIPEMRRHGYDIRLATGTVASAGTLGILIPPSIILVIYAILAEESVPDLFAAGILPGLIFAALHVALIVLIGRLSPQRVPREPGAGAGARLRALGGFWKLGLLFTLAVGGIYSGWFSPTEAAAVGATGAIAIGFATRALRLPDLFGCLRETVRTTAALILVMLGGFMFSYFITVSRIPVALGEYLVGSALPPVVVILCLAAIYLVLGLFLDSISMMLVTVPVFLPIVLALGYDSLWFGIFVVIVAEVGLITPPVGMNIYVLKAQLPDLTLRDLYGGILPFVGVALLMIGLLIAFPQLVLRAG